METEKFLEQFNPPTDKNYGLFQRKSDGKVFEWKEFLELFNNQKTTSQQQTIERLREIVKKYIHDKKGVAGLTPLGTDMYNDLHNEIKEAEQLLNTTEPNKTV